MDVREKLVELLWEYDQMRMMRMSIEECADRLIPKGLAVGKCENDTKCSDIAICLDENAKEKTERIVDLMTSFYGVDSGYYGAEAYPLASHLIAHGVTVQEWISVKDRLPDKDGCYIVTACDEGCSCGDGIWYDTVVIEVEYYKGEWSWNENGTEYDITDFVTHWQPMPQAPKGE